MDDSIFFTFIDDLLSKGESAFNTFSLCCIYEGVYRSFVTSKNILDKYPSIIEFFYAGNVENSKLVAYTKNNNKRLIFPNEDIFSSESIEIQNKQEENNILFVKYKTQDNYIPVKYVRNSTEIDIIKRSLGKYKLFDCVYSSEEKSFVYNDFYEICPEDIQEYILQACRFFLIPIDFLGIQTLDYSIQEYSHLESQMRILHLQKWNLDTKERSCMNYFGKDRYIEETFDNKDIGIIQYAYNAYWKEIPDSILTYIKALHEDPSINLIVMNTAFRWDEKEMHSSFFFIDKKNDTILRYDPHGIYSRKTEDAYTDLENLKSQLFLDSSVEIHENKTISLQNIGDTIGLCEGYTYTVATILCGAYRLIEDEKKISVPIHLILNCIDYVIYETVYKNMQKENEELASSLINYYILQYAEYVANYKKFAHFEEYRIVAMFLFSDKPLTRDPFEWRERNEDLECLSLFLDIYGESSKKDNVNSCISLYNKLLNKFFFSYVYPFIAMFGIEMYRFFIQNNISFPQKELEHLYVKLSAFFDPSVKEYAKSRISF